MACMRINMRRWFGAVDGDVERVRFTFMGEERDETAKGLAGKGKCLGLLKHEVAAGIRRATHPYSVQRTAYVELWRRWLQIGYKCKWTISTTSSTRFGIPCV